MILCKGSGPFIKLHTHDHEPGSVVNCVWYGGGPVSERALKDDPLHPWDQELRAHIVSEHKNQISDSVCDIVQLVGNEIWDLYQYALSAAE